jgi:hypothetical protein
MRALSYCVNMSLAMMASATCGAAIRFISSSRVCSGPSSSLLPLSTSSRKDVACCRQLCCMKTSVTTLKSSVTPCVEAARSEAGSVRPPTRRKGGGGVRETQLRRVFRPCAAGGGAGRRPAAHLGAGELLRELERTRRVDAHDVGEQEAPVGRVVDLLAVDHDLVELRRRQRGAGSADGPRAWRGGRRRAAGGGRHLASLHEALDDLGRGLGAQVDRERELLVDHLQGTGRGGARA